MLHHGADDALGVITVAGVRDVHVLTVTVELLPVCCDGENIRVFARQPGWYRVKMCIRDSYSDVPEDPEGLSLTREMMSVFQKNFTSEKMS